MLTGQILNDKYKIKEIIKSLNFITIYKGIDLKKEKELIIKELTGFFPNPVVRQQALEYFKLEAKRHFRMSHPYLPKYKDYFDFESKRYLILEAVKGKTFKELIEEGQTLTHREILSWTVKICEALSHLHRLKPEPIIFKNLNPETIYLSMNIDIKLFDMGTGKKNNIFEPLYTCFSSPEQYGGEVDRKTDIYSLGAILYYLLTRKLPPDALDLEDDPILLIDSLNKNIPPGLKNIILKAMAIEKDDRYPSIEHMKREIQHILNEPPGARKEQVEPVPVPAKTSPLAGYRKIRDERKEQAGPVPVSSKPSPLTGYRKIQEERKEQTGPVPVSSKPSPLTGYRKIQGERKGQTVSAKTSPLAGYRKIQEERKRRPLINREPVNQEKTPEEKKFSAFKFSRGKSGNEKVFKKSSPIERVPSGVKRLREKKKVTEEKLEAVTERLKKELTYNDLRPENKDLKQALADIRNKRKERKIIAKRGTGHLTQDKMSPSGDDTGQFNTPLIPDNLIRNRYKIMDVIITSPLSITYKGMDEENQEIIMIKELKDSQPDLAAREQALSQFKTEAKMLFKLLHPNLPRYKDYFDYRFKRYLIMEYIEGTNLKMITENSIDLFDEVQVIDWGFQICGALHFLHKIKPQPIIFRNLKPENILLQTGGTLKLLDFGISKFFQISQKTIEIAKIINKNFSPIEQFNGMTDERTDIYSLGAVLYYLSTKVVPPDAMDINLGEAKLYPPGKYNPKLSKEFNSVIMKAMKFHKEDRFKTAEEFNEALRNILMTI